VHDGETDELPYHRQRCQIPHGGYVYTESLSAECCGKPTNTGPPLKKHGHTLAGRLGDFPNTVCVMAAGMHDMRMVFLKGGC
jgi:hypothetical protein